MDFGHVRRVRERGMYGLCQTLKSFRDHRVEFPPYVNAQADAGAFAELGPLAMPARESPDVPGDTASENWITGRTGTGLHFRVTDCSIVGESAVGKAREKLSL
jgi:hypothetical protein